MSRIRHRERDVIWSVTTTTDRSLASASAADVTSRYNMTRCPPPFIVVRQQRSWQRWSIEFGDIGPIGCGCCVTARAAVFSHKSLEHLLFLQILPTAAFLFLL